VGVPSTDMLGCRRARRVARVASAIRADQRRNIGALGMQRSAGIMVNYLYRLADLEKNHESYSRDFQVVAASEIESLAKSANLQKRPAKTS